MASTSVPRSRNSRATSWIAGSDSVTRTVPSPPTISASRRARSAPPLRFARACGLMMTPMPGTLGRGARRGELPAGGLDVLPPALADGRVHAVVAQDRLVVGERLTHAHEDDVRERARGGERAAGAHLTHDLGGREVAHEAHARRRAEAAPHPAARLARDAEREPVARAGLALELRDEDALDRGGTRVALTREVEEELPRAVGGVGDEDGRQPAE